MKTSDKDKKKKKLKNDLEKLGFTNIEVNPREIGSLVPKEVIEVLGNRGGKKGVVPNKKGYNRKKFKKFDF